NHLKVDVVASVRTDPVLGQSRVIGSHILAPTKSFLIRTISIDSDGLRYSTRIPMRVFTRSKTPLLPGEVIALSGALSLSKDRKFAANLQSNGQIQLIRAAPWYQQLAGSIRRHFREVNKRLTGDSGALIPGLVIGDTSLENQGFVSQMKRVGLTHLTAVSGENFAIVAGFLLWVMQWLVRSYRKRIIVTGIFLAGFIVLVRPSPSVLRASVMTAVLLIARSRGERSSPLPALGLAIAVLLLFDPFQSVDPGFALSVSATAGILILAPVIEEKLESRRWVSLLSIPLSATIFCTPIIIGMTGQLSLMSIPANLLVGTVVGPITVVGFVSALIAWPIPGVAFLLVKLINPISEWVVLVARFLSKVPVLVVPKSFMGAGIFLIGLWIFFRKRKAFFVLGLVIALISYSIHAFTWPGRDWVFVNCDVGQGDGAVINLGAGQGIVLDTGPDPTLMDRCLAQLGITKIALLVLTHFHADHVMGLAGVLHGRKVGHVWVSNLNQPLVEYQLTLHLLNGLPLTVVHQGQSVDFDAPGEHIHILVLWPLESVTKFAALPGDGSTINNASIALTITINNFRIFAGGDIEPEAQQAVLESGLVSKVDLLKVSHHGSAYQYLPLMDALSPRLAVISVGKGNSYGHPSPQTISTLRSRGIVVLRTDVDGAVAIDPALRIRTRKREWWQISWG
ncbi:MAG: ComEC/Rec2 family competence protein, partial [Actinomycetes bacterium]